MLRLKVKNKNTKKPTTTVKNTKTTKIAKMTKITKTAKKTRATKKTVKPVNKSTFTNKNEYVVMDHPRNLENITSWHYAVRMGTGVNCEKVDVSIDDKPWQACRYSNGYWWYDWTNYTPGSHQLIARMTKTNGQYLITKKRRCRTV